MHGTFINQWNLQVVMSGPDQTDVEINVAQTVNGPGTNFGWVTLVPFFNAAAYDTITYTYTNQDIDGSRARFMGVILDAVEPDPEPLVLQIANNGANLDFSWNGMAGMQYTLVSSTDPESEPDPSMWLPYDDGTEVYENIRDFSVTTGRVGDLRFFALIEEPIPPLFFEDFEGPDDAGFTATATSGTTWTRGMPMSAGPGGAVNGGDDSDNAWGTNLTGFYAANTVDSCLRSRVIDLTMVAGAELTFAQALDFPAGDTAVVRLIDENTQNEIVFGDFPLTVVDADDLASPWVSAGTFALPVGATIRIEWCLTGTGGATADYMGWYIDNVEVNETAAVDP
jgi:hypothetical protein